MELGGVNDVRVLDVPLLLVNDVLRLRHSQRNAVHLVEPLLLLDRVDHVQLAEEQDLHLLYHLFELWGVLNLLLLLVILIVHCRLDVQLRNVICLR